MKIENPYNHVPTGEIVTVEYKGKKVKADIYENEYLCDRIYLINGKFIIGKLDEL